MPSKVCSRCGLDKDFSEFHKRKDRDIGIQSFCKECSKLRKDKYLSTPAGKAKQEEYSKGYYAQNKDFVLDLNRKWRENNHEYRAQYMAEYERTFRKRDPDLSKKYHKVARARAIERNPMFKLNQTMSVSIRKGLLNGKEGWKWESLAGYTCKELAAHLGNTVPIGYSWDAYLEGKTDLEIDHIIPIAAFNFRTIRDIDFKRCWNMKNLRLLPKSENCSKSNRLVSPFQPSLQISVGT